jgi:SAM-dependent methyltransferase
MMIGMPANTLQTNTDHQILGTAKRGPIPWWAKLGSKLCLSRLPIPYRAWAALNLFKHGRMNQVEPALRNFKRHYGKVAHALPPGFSVLEMGPGDSAATGIIAAAHGASECTLVDVGRFASEDTGFYRALLAPLREAGLILPPIGNVTGLDSILAAANCAYLNSGLDSYRQIASASVDFIFSNAVLEHVLRSEFEATIRETRRILKPGGYCSHLVDLQDHLDGSLNNLRFPASIWETGLFRRSGFYTNRIRYQEMVGIFKRTGFKVEGVREIRWRDLPLSKGKLALPYRDLPEDDLKISGFDILLSAA